MDQRPRDFDPPLHARRERPHQRVTPILKLDEREQLVDALAARRCRHLIDQPMKIEVLEHGQPVVDARFLKHDAQMTACHPGLPRHVETSQRDGAGIRRQDGAEDVDQRRLAGPVGSKQREQLVRLYLQADPIKRDRAAIALRQTTHANDRVGALSRRRPYAVHTMHHGHPGFGVGVMAGLVPAIYALLAEARQERRGCPRQARA